MEWAQLSTRGCDTDYSSVEAVWVGLRQRRTSGPLEWTDENTIPYNMHYDGQLMSADIAFVIC